VTSHSGKIMHVSAGAVANNAPRFLELTRNLEYKIINLARNTETHTLEKLFRSKTLISLKFSSPVFGPETFVFELIHNILRSIPYHIFGSTNKLRLREKQYCIEQCLPLRDTPRRRVGFAYVKFNPFQWS
jgi:hypothetical protein